MCGFAGVFSRDLPRGILYQIADKMSDSLSHRGPDDRGNWTDYNLGLSISHQRLSILDLTISGRQPMVSQNKRFVLAFNGEIYNHFDLRNDLKNNFQINNWRSSSDTEVLLECIACYGLRNTLRKVVGMFAFSLFDREQKKLYLVRDRFGEKPLYYSFINNESSFSFCFASELVAFKFHPNFERKISTESFLQYSQFGYLSAPNSIYENVFQIKPGHLIELDLSKPFTNYEQEEWWSLLSIAKESSQNKFSNQNEAIEKLEFVIERAIKEQSIADVKIGSFLSGGIDSSLVTALLNKNTNNLNTFTIGFEDSKFDESRYSKLIAQHLNTNHFESILGTDELLEIVPDLPIIYSEPFADSSQIPTYLVCREARKMGLKVCITGDGADEIFGGYNRYLWSKRIWNYVSWLPYNLRFLLSIIIRRLPNQFIDLIAKVLYIDKCQHKLLKLADRLNSVKDIDGLYLSLISIFPNHKLPINETFNSANNRYLNPANQVKSFFENDINEINTMMLSDSIGYLPNDILTKVDRASMAVGLETRAPFLDHRVLEVALRLPDQLKINTKINFGTKIILRKILNKYIPNKLIQRPKTGFGIPVGEWLRTNLKDWSYEIINQKNSYFYDSKFTKKLLFEHNYRNFDHTEKLWSILMWELWFKEHD